MHGQASSMEAYPSCAQPEPTANSCHQGRLNDRQSHLQAKIIGHVKNPSASLIRYGVGLPAGIAQLPGPAARAEIAKCQLHRTRSNLADRTTSSHRYCAENGAQRQVCKPLDAPCASALRKGSLAANSL